VSGSADRKIIIWKKEAIVNLESYPEINEKLLKSKSLSNENKQKYITDIMSDYTMFSKYFVKNYLIKNGNKTSIKNMNYSHFFTLISPFLHLNDLSAFANIIIKFINSVPLELNKSFYSGHVNGSSETRKFILEIYNNIMIEYINFLQKVFKYESPYYDLFQYETKRDNELKLLLEAFKSKIINPNNRVKITYIGEIGINAGGLSREFFKNLEKQLNSKKDLSEKEIIDILIFSKVNNDPIYLNNYELKALILKKVTNNIKKHLNKNVIYNFLYNVGNINYQMKDLVFLTNNNNEILPLGYTKEQFNNYIKNKSDSNKNKNNNYLLDNPNINNSKNDFFIHYINCKFDNNKIYKNFLDFYISHFINFSLNVDDIINNLTFINATEEFQLKFKGLLKNLSEEELKKFNECISGSFKLQPKYEIEIINYGNKISKYSTYHTCFQRMDIYGIDNFIKNFLEFENNSNNYKKLVIKEQCKKDFIETINTTLGIGFNMS
jgi:hypothetical protein